MKRAAFFGIFVLALASAAPVGAADVTEIVVETDGVRPPVAHVALDAPVRFVNRTRRDIHVDLLGPEGEHHVVNVPGRIWAAFHRPGRHPFVVHAVSTGREIARGVVEVAEDVPRKGPPVCGWITVEGICIER
jgi:hypothetical protein